jgi:hypothetical protein
MRRGTWGRGFIGFCGNRSGNQVGEIILVHERWCALTLIQMAIKKYIAMRQRIIYDSPGRPIGSREDSLQESALPPVHSYGSRESYMTLSQTEYTETSPRTGRRSRFFIGKMP